MEKYKLSREDVIKVILDSHNGELEANEDEIMNMLLESKVTKNINEVHTKIFSKGDVMADKLANFAGSWIFIGIFIFVLLSWISLNVLAGKIAFDPFPFILLNLILSCIAAIQAPIIMMSQNRQEAKDRIRSKNDYRVNLKSELLVEELYKKITNLEVQIEDLSKEIKVRRRE